MNFIQINIDIDFYPMNLLNFIVLLHSKYCDWDENQSKSCEIYERHLIGLVGHWCLCFRSSYGSWMLHHMFTKVNKSIQNATTCAHTFNKRITFHIDTVYTIPSINSMLLCIPFWDSNENQILPLLACFTLTPHFRSPS